MTARTTQVFRNFDLSLISPTRPWKLLDCLGLFIISDMWVQVWERKQDEDQLKT